MTRLDKAILGFLVGFFAFSALDKLVHMHGFIRALESYRFIPVALGRPLAPIVIAVELAIALGLAVPAYRAMAASLEIGFIVVVTVAAVLQQVLGDSDICGCWFSINMVSGPVHVVFNMILLIFGEFLRRSARASRAVSTPGVEGSAR